MTVRAAPARTDRPGSRGAMTPELYRVVDRRDETSDVTTLSMEPVDGGALAFGAGQFNMLSALGVGECAISISSEPPGSGPLEHTIRDVGPVTHALCRTRIGSVVGVRGPFGTSWPLAPLPDDGDVLVIAGGIGLAPLRGAVRSLRSARTGDPSSVAVLVGAREPAQILFGDDLSQWAAQGLQVSVTVDVSSRGWSGHVGLVTTLLGEVAFDPARATVLVCGPEIMMRFVARDLQDRGVDPARIFVSLERNMQCGIAWCGHCQLGPYLLCRDGPVLPYAGAVARLLSERER